MADPTPSKRLPKAATLAWAEGYTARLHRFEREDNPYREGDDDPREDDWDEGWFAAHEDIARGKAPAGMVKDDDRP
jgi:hypothetical protein